jgi:hypothetical protein
MTQRLWAIGFSPADMAEIAAIDAVTTAQGLASPSGAVCEPCSSPLWAMAHRRPKRDGATPADHVYAMLAAHFVGAEVPTADAARRSVRSKLVQLRSGMSRGAAHLHCARRRQSRRRGYRARAMRPRARGWLQRGLAEVSHLDARDPERRLRRELDSSDELCRLSRERDVQRRGGCRRGELQHVGYGNALPSARSVHGRKMQRSRSKSVPVSVRQSVVPASRVQLHRSRASPDSQVHASRP